MNLNAHDIKKRFISFCKEHQISQVNVANAAGIAQSSVSHWFNYDKDTLPNIFAIYYLMSEHGLSADWLFTGKEAENKQLISQSHNYNGTQTAGKDCSNCAVVLALIEKIK